jgi:hypothetical protein
MILREESRLRVFENRVLRRIFGPKRDKATGEWRKLDNEELNDLYSSPNIARVTKSRRMRWAGHVAPMAEGRVLYRVLVSKPEGKDQWGDLGVDGRIIFRQIFRQWDVRVWTGLRWLRRDRWRALVNAVMNFRVPLNAGNSLTSYKPVSSSRRTVLQGVSK